MLHELRDYCPFCVFLFFDGFPIPGLSTSVWAWHCLGLSTLHPAGQEPLLKAIVQPTFDVTGYIHWRLTGVPASTFECSKGETLHLNLEDLDRVGRVGAPIGELIGISPTDNRVDPLEDCKNCLQLR